MSLVINYDSNFSNFSYNGEGGLAAYLQYYEDSFAGATLGFHNSPGSMEIGSSTYSDQFFGAQIIGEQMTSTSTTVANSSFAVEAGNITYEDSNGDSYDEAALIYTGMTAPAHVVAGAIETLTFGDGAYNDGSLAANLFSIEGLDTTLSTGLLDNDDDGAHDAVESGGETHALINDLMNGGTSVMEDILNANNLIYNGTAADETFDSFQGNDLMFGGGGDDTFRFYEDNGEDVVFDFCAGSGDILSFSSAVFDDAADALAHTTSYGYGNFGFSIIDDGNGNQVFVLGVTNLTAADFEVFAA